jgi:serine/threonine-protein kinase
MGVVYLVEHRQLQKRFAMKVLLRDVFERDPEASTRFVWEARAAARVQHPGIVSVSDFGNLADGRAFLVMELLSGKSVAEVLKAGGAMDPARAMALIASAADALQAAHAAGVVHRDLTPSNIFIEAADGGERAKLVDFGAAKLVTPGDGRDLKAEGREPIVFGTPYYMAPEHAQGRGTDARADIYSLGCCLFEMLTGRVPYRARSVREILLKHILAELPEPWSPRGPLPSCINAVIGRMMAKLPSDRYRGAGELSADLRVCAGMLEEGGS